MSDPYDAVVLHPTGDGDEAAALNGRRPPDAFEASAFPWEARARAESPPPTLRRLLTALLRGLAVWPT